MTTDFGYAFYDTLMYLGGIVTVVGITLTIIAILLIGVGKLVNFVMPADADSE